VTSKWRGPIAPIGKMTGDRRVFESGSLTNRNTPLPMMWQEEKQPGHMGARIVGSVDSINLGQNPVYGHGQWLPEDLFPYVTQAKLLAKEGLVGPSVDLGSMIAKGVQQPDGQLALSVSSGEIAGMTLVQIPAFSDLRLELFDDDDLVSPLVASSLWRSYEYYHRLGAPELEFGSVGTPNKDGWQSFPIAERNAEFDADDAVRRIAAWAGQGSRKPDVQKMQSAFLWQANDGSPMDVRTYRMPIGDIIDGEMTMIYHAIYAAAALINGAHGGLPNVPQAEKDALVPIINRMYEKMSEAFGERLEPPWNQGAPPQQRKDSLSMDTAFSIRTSWDLPIGSANATWDKGAALRALDTWAGDDMSKYAQAFLYKDDSLPTDQKGTYKFPIAMPVDGKLTIIPSAVRNALARVSGADIPSADKDKLTATARGILNQANSEHGLADDGLVAGGGPLAPMIEDFEQPEPAGPQTIRVNGYRVSGHIFQHGVCHTGIGNVCVEPPRSKVGYEHFHKGTVVLSDGKPLKVGKITLAGGHADGKLGMVPAAAHYDNSCTAVAIGRVVDGEHGGWFSGVLLPGVSDERKAELLRSPISGDWRPDRANGNHFELIAALAVNVPGFPITEVVDGEQTSLIAAGMVYDEFSIGEPVEPDVQKDDDNEDLVAELAAFYAADQAKLGSELAALKGE